jgi:hypothetical protein
MNTKAAKPEAHEADERQRPEDPATSKAPGMQDQRGEGRKVGTAWAKHR